jgi:transcription termination/antitermination protein NusG
MNETESPETRPALDPESDEAADLAVRAETDEATEVALGEAGGPGAAPDDAPIEAAAALSSEARVDPDEGSPEAGAEEATMLEADAEEVLPEDIADAEVDTPISPDAFEPTDDYVANADARDEAAAPPTPTATVETLEAPDEAMPAPPVGDEREEELPGEDVPEQAEAEEVEQGLREEDAAEVLPVPVEEPRPEVVETSSPFDGPGDWYVIHTYAGYENKVKANLHSRIGSMQMEEKIFDVVIPMEDVMEIKGGKKQVVQKKVFPGYLLVKMVYDNDSWYVVRNTPGVTGFVSSGTGTKPTPLSRREVEKILAVKQETQRKPEYRLEWEEGDVVRIIAGPFADFQGTIAEINVEQSKLKVLVNIFDRETPVELAFDQVAKA